MAILDPRKPKTPAIVPQPLATSQTNLTAMAPRTGTNVPRMTIAPPTVPTMAQAFTAANPVAEQPPLSPEQVYSAGKSVVAMAPPTSFDSEMAAYRARQGNPSMPAYTGAPGPDPNLKATIVPINTPMNPIVNGVGGGDRNVVETNPLMRQAQDRGTIAMVAGGNGSTGVVAGADGVMMSPDQYIRENTQAMASPFRAGTNAEIDAAKVAYNDFQERSKNNVLTGGSTGGMGGPTFNLRPSKEERVAGVASRGAIGLAQETGKTAIEVAKQGTLTAIEQAKATEAEKTRRAQEVKEGKVIDAKARTDAATIAAGSKGASSGDSASYKASLDALDAERTELIRQQGMAESAAGWYTNGEEQKSIDDIKAQIADVTQRRMDLINRGMGGGQTQAIPGQSKAGQPKAVNSQAEYDKLPAGSSYLDAQGNVRRKAA